MEDKPKELEDLFKFCEHGHLEEIANYFKVFKKGKKDEKTLVLDEETQITPLDIAAANDQVITLWNKDVIFI